MTCKQQIICLRLLWSASTQNTFVNMVSTKRSNPNYVRSLKVCNFVELPVTCKGLSTTTYNYCVKIFMFNKSQYHFDSRFTRIFAITLLIRARFQPFLRLLKCYSLSCHRKDFDLKQRVLNKLIVTYLNISCSKQSINFPLRPA